MHDVYYELKFTFRVENFIVTHVDSYERVVKSIRFYIRATNIYTMYHEVFHVINFDTEKMDFSNFIPFDQVTEEIANEWIKKSLSGTNYDRIKQQLYEKFYPKEWSVTPYWVNTDVKKNKEK